MSDIWDEADWYDSIALSLASDIPAYKALYDVLDVQGDTVLDFGCHKGASSAAIARLGADVIGVDKSEDSIEAARHQHGSVSFYHVGTDSSIPINTTVDTVTMSFVHPTIDSKDELYEAFKKSHNTLKNDGRIGLLGLHPDSFDASYSFLNYNHKLPEHASYTDGQPFLNEVQPLEGSPISFTDYCWTSPALEKLLLDAGFASAHTVPVTHSHSLVGSTVGDVAETIADKNGIAWEDEFSAPLYQLIIAKR